MSKRIARYTGIISFAGAVIFVIFFFELQPLFPHALSTEIWEHSDIIWDITITISPLIAFIFGIVWLIAFRASSSTPNKIIDVICFFAGSLGLITCLGIVILIVIGFLGLKGG